MSPEHERLLALWRERWPQREAALVAFVVPNDGVALDADEVRNALTQRLPATLLPARVVVCDELPRTPAGKVDRGALQLPAEAAAPRRPALAPRTAVEQRLMELYAQVLGAQPYGVDDDFFAHLGGHSLLATQLGSLIRQEWPIGFELRSVFEQPTVAGLAGCIEKALRQAAPALDSQPIPRRAPPATDDGTAA